MSTRSGEKEGRPSMSPVHSANQWEAADFDDKQKEKFLRLMGGMKKQHTGRFVIGETNRDAHSRTDDETKEMEKTLEEQYQVGLEKKLTGQNRRHIGLGFSEPEEKKEEKEGGTHVRFDEEDDDVSKESETFHRELEDSTKDEGDGKRDTESEKERRADRQKQDEKSRDRDRERERRGSREQDPERDRSHRSSRDEDRKHNDRDDRKRKGEKDDEARRDSKTSTSKLGDSSRSEKKKHGHLEEGGEPTEQKSKKHKHREDDSGSD